MFKGSNRPGSSFNTDIKHDVETQKSPESNKKTTQFQSQFNLLEIPTELACIFSKLEGQSFYYEYIQIN